VIGCCVVMSGGLVGGTDGRWVQLLASEFDDVYHLSNGEGGLDLLVSGPVVVTVGKLLGIGAEVVIGSECHSVG
jgi:hypothetical protein